jgi:hypothetical protein
MIGSPAGRLLLKKMFIELISVTGHTILKIY